MKIKINTYYDFSLIPESMQDKVYLLHLAIEHYRMTHDRKNPDNPQTNFFLEVKVRYPRQRRWLD